MSERRALEFNFIQKLKEEFDGSRYGIVESNTYEERKVPCIVVVVADSGSLIDHPNAQDNFDSELDIMIISSSDESTPDEHMNVCDKVRQVILNKQKLRITKVRYLHIYNIIYQGVTDMRQERRLGTQMKFQVHYNYNASPDISY